VVFDFSGGKPAFLTEHDGVELIYPMSLLTKNIGESFLAASIFMLIVYVFPVAVAAQTVPCKVPLSSLSAAPELKGFQLGMTMEEAKLQAPLLVFPPADPLGNIKTTINPGFDPRAEKSKFQDVRTISLDFLDGRLVALWIGYDANFRWSTVEAFVTGITKSLNLPNAWSDWKSRGKQMICTDFEVTVSTIAQSPSLRIVDTAAEKTLTARRNAAAEEVEANEADDSEEEIVADSKTKTYYQGTCRPSDPIAEANRVTFKSTVEAEKAGYTLSRGCS
jgi:hypothetical protein